MTRLPTLRFPTLRRAFSGYLHEDGLVEAGSGGGHDPGARRQLAVAVAQVEGGQELADGEVAGAAEDNDVSGRDGGRTAGLGHGVISRWRRGRDPTVRRVMYPCKHYLGISEIKVDRFVSSGVAPVVECRP